MRRQIWNKPEQWLHNLAKAHCPSQLYLQLFLLLYFSSPTIFHIRLIFNLFSLVFSLPHTYTSSISNPLIFTLLTFEFYPIFMRSLHINWHTILSFHDFIFLYIFLLSHATYLSFPLKSILSSLFFSLSFWWTSKFDKHDCVSHNIPLILILLFFYSSSYEAKDYSVFKERNNGNFGLF